MAALEAASVDREIEPFAVFIARAVERAGPHAWDHRQTIGGGAKLGFVIKGLWQALTPAPAMPPLRWGRRDLAALVRAAAAADGRTLPGGASVFRGPS